MLIKSKKIAELNELLESYNFKKLEKEYGAKLLICSGDEMLNNKQILLNTGITKQEVDSYLQKTFLDFVGNYGCYGFDSKTGSNIFGVAFIMPILTKSGTGEIKKKHMDFLSRKEAIEKLEQYKAEGII